MNTSPDICRDCGEAIQPADRYCPGCGTIFRDEVTCHNHPSVFAGGRCTICGCACCKKCGLRVNRMFLCDPHSGYEIIEGMARISGSSDSIDLEAAHHILEEEGYHPFLLTIPQGDGSFVDYNLEMIKLLVPCKEVLGAEKLIGGLRSPDMKKS